MVEVYFVEDDFLQEQRLLGGLQGDEGFFRDPEGGLAHFEFNGALDFAAGECLGLLAGESPYLALRGGYDLGGGESGSYKGGFADVEVERMQRDWDFEGGLGGEIVQANSGLPGLPGELE